MDSLSPACSCKNKRLSEEGSGSPSCFKPSSFHSNSSLDQIPIKSSPSYTKNGTCSNPCAKSGFSSRACYFKHPGKVSFFGSKNALVESKKKNEEFSRRETQKKLAYYSEKVEETAYYLKLMNKITADSENCGLDSYDRYFIERCVTLRDISEKDCENGHKDVEYHHCGEERFCPRCISRDVQERSEEVMSKYDRFGIKRWKKRIYTVPEELRKRVYEDMNKFTELVYRVEYRFHHHTLLAGVCFMHEYSTHEPYLIKPHAEVYIGDLGLKVGKHSFQQTLRDDKKKRGKKICKKGIKKGRKKPISINLWEEKEDLERLKKLYKKELEETYDVKLDDVDIWISYTDDYALMRYHKIPYALKPPIKPEWVKYVAYDYGEEGIVEYSNDDWTTVATIKDFAKCLRLKYYSKRNFHRLRYFGFLANSVWKKYYKRIYNEKVEPKPKPSKEEQFYCNFCGGSIVKITTNVYKKFEQYRLCFTNVEFNEDLEVEDVALGEKICRNCERYPCLRDRAMLPKDKCAYRDKFKYKKNLWVV